MAQKLKFGNGTWATKEGSTLAYNDENGNYKPLPFSVSRASTATRVNKQGLIEVVGQNKARVDYSETSNGALLLEPSRTNVVLYSEDISNGFYTATNGTVTTNTAIAPDGTLTADTWTATSASAQIQGVAIITSGVAYTMSLYLKRKTGTGQVSLRGVTNTSTAVTITDEWARYSVTLTSTDIYGRCGVILAESGDEVYVWGVQLEAGSYATSYIPTSGSSVTRVADAANNCGNSAVFNDSEGVLYANIADFSNDSFRQLTVSSGSNTNAVSIMNTTTLNQVICFVNSGGVTQASISTTVNNTKDLNKVAIKYKTNDFSVFVNGFKTGVDTSGITPVGLDRLNFDNGAGGSAVYGKTKELGYYDAILTDAELEYLTSYRSLAEMVTELNLNQL